MPSKELTGGNSEGLTGGNPEGLTGGNPEEFAKNTKLSFLYQNYTREHRGNLYSHHQKE